MAFKKAQVLRTNRVITSDEGREFPANSRAVVLREIKDTNLVLVKFNHNGTLHRASVPTEAFELTKPGRPTKPKAPAKV